MWEVLWKKGYTFGLNLILKAKTVSNVNSRVAKSKHLALEVSLWTFWYLAMFPGRVGYDTKVSLELLRSGGSTDWWTGWYWRVLQALSLNGATVILFASFSYLLAIFSFYWVVNSLPMSIRRRRNLARAVVALPILPVFAMTVQHDIFLLCGLLILFGLELRIANGVEIREKTIRVIVLSILVMVLTSHQGLILAVYVCIRAKVILRGTLLSLIFSIAGVLFFSVASTFAIDNTEDKESGKFTPPLMDIKCIIQDTDSDVSQSEWAVFTKLLPREKWMQPYRCDDINANDWLNTVDYSQIDTLEFAKTYLSLTVRNGELAIMSHVARSNYVLPPPFFSIPPNQVSLDFTRPIGEGTNSALQSGPPLLHPSVDDPYVRIKPKVLMPLEYLAQVSIFFVNQASWFWGWGGLWLWPILIYSYLVRKSGFYFPLLAPFLLLHITLFALGISSTPRHVTPTIVVGVITSLATVMRFNPRGETNKIP